MNTQTVFHHQVTNPQLRHKLMEHSYSPDERIRAAAFAGLGNLSGDEQLVRRLRDGLEDDSQAVRQAAAKSLERQIFQMISA